MRPNNSFKPNPLRYTNHMAGKACHVVGSATRIGLTQALGRLEIMPYFKVRLSGAGISYSFADGSDPVIGFFTTRLVRAPDLTQAHHAATEVVLSEWRPGGQYASDNVGSLPELVVEESWPVSLLSGIFGRRPGGYTFYTHDD